MAKPGEPSGELENRWVIRLSRYFAWAVPCTCIAVSRRPSRQKCVFERFCSISVFYCGIAGLLYAKEILYAQSSLPLLPPLAAAGGLHRALCAGSRTECAPRWQPPSALPPPDKNIPPAAAWECVVRACAHCVRVRVAGSFQADPNWNHGAAPLAVQQRRAGRPLFGGSPPGCPTMLGEAVHTHGTAMQLARPLQRTPGKPEATKAWEEGSEATGHGWWGKKSFCRSPHDGGVESASKRIPASAAPFRRRPTQPIKSPIPDHPSSQPGRKPKRLHSRCHCFSAFLLLCSLFVLPKPFIALRMFSVSKYAMPPESVPRWVSPHLGSVASACYRVGGRVKRGGSMPHHPRRGGGRAQNSGVRHGIPHRRAKCVCVGGGPMAPGRARPAERAQWSSRGAETARVTQKPQLLPHPSSGPGWS